MTFAFRATIQTLIIFSMFLFFYFSCLSLCFFFLNTRIAFQPQLNVLNDSKLPRSYGTGRFVYKNSKVHYFFLIFQRRPKPRPAVTRPHTTTTAAPFDPRRECPGTCVVPIVSFSCFSKFLHKVI